jgi:poly-gamma-glutamate synthesis protein (capsule biosynthesis protein)
MVEEEAAEFSYEIEHLSATLADPDALADAWQGFCRGKQREYVAKLVAWNRVADTLWSRGLLPVGMLKKRALMLLNLVRCQSHRNVLIEVLEQISGGAGH